MLFTARPANMKFTGIMRIFLSMMLIEGIQVSARPLASRHLSKMNEDYDTSLIPLVPRDLSNELIKEYGLYVKPRVRRKTGKKNKGKKKGKREKG